MHRNMVEADFAHDLKVPIQLIASCAALLEEERQISERGRRYVRMLTHSARELERAVSGRVRENGAARDVVAFARNLAGEFALIAERQGVRVQFRENASCFRMAVDTEKLRRILHNLLANALKSTPRGGKILLEARLLGDAMEFSVADTGCGIPERLRERIFERGVSDGGTGRGLAIVKELAAELGGSIDVESARGEGSRFCLRLPVGVGR